MEEIYQVDELSWFIALFRRRAHSWRECELMEWYVTELERLTSNWFPDTRLKQLE